MHLNNIQPFPLMLTKQILVVFMTVFVFSPLAQAELLWSPKPVDKVSSADSKANKNQHAQHGHHSRSKEKAYYLHNNKNSSVSYIDPSLKATELTASDTGNKYILPKTGMDNYHALVAQRQSDSLHESSLRYVYMRGKPSGYSPDNLVKNHKLPLEIVPVPMIREHLRFYSNRGHTFQVLFNEQPVPDSWVVLQTTNGTTLDAKTDVDGKVSFVFPDDFKDVKPGRRANKAQDFLLRTVHIKNNITYKTNFSAPYSVNPEHWQSNSGGILALSIGFISGLVLMRRHNKNIAEKKPTGKTRKKVDNKASGEQS